jgi:hypothetical protein
MKRLTLLCLCLALPGPPGPSAAQPAPGRAPSDAQAQPIVLEFDRIDIQRVAQNLSERTQKNVVLDGSVKQTLPVTSTGSARTLEEALDRLTKPLGLVWKKVYVTRTTGAASGERIARLVETVKGVASTGIVVEDPATRKVTLYLRDLPAAPDLEAQIRTAWPFLDPVYLVSDPRPSARSDEKKQRPKPNSPEQFAEMERERMDLFLKMSPEDRAKAMQQAMNQVFQADPAAMQQMMQAGMQAWMQMMQQMTPEQRQQFLTMSMQMMQSIPPETWQNLFQMFRPGPGVPPPPR